MRGRALLAATVTATAALVVLVPSASAFTAPPTDTSTWRAAPSGIPDLAGSTLTDGDIWEGIQRYGNSDSGSLSSSWSSRSVADQNFLTRFYNHTTGNVQGQLSLWETEEAAAMSKVELGTATSLQARTAAALFKSRAALGLAPELLSWGAVAITVGTASDLTERALVAGENKLFGWHIQLKGPFGIFGSWSQSSAAPGGVPDFGSNKTLTINSIKWKVETPAARCGATSTGGCPIWDVLMNAQVGSSTIGSTDPACNCTKLFFAEPQAVDQTVGGGSTTTSIPDVVNADPCFANGFYDSGGTNFGMCSEGSSYQDVRTAALFEALDPATHSGGVTTNGVPYPGSTGSGLAGGQFVKTRNCTAGLSNVCVAYAMTEAQMEKFVDGIHSKSYERNSKSGDHTDIQGGADPASPPNNTVINVVNNNSTPNTDTQRATGQAAPRDGTGTSGTTDPANQADCFAAGTSCPDPWADSYTVPECVGLLVSACVTALQAAGFGGAHVDTTLALLSAEMNYPAGAIVAIDPNGGAEAGVDQQFALTLNPSPLPAQIPDRIDGNEGVTDWENRLRATGYTGTVTRVVLDPASADPSAGPGTETFPVTDPTTGKQLHPGDVLDPSDPLTVYVNPDNVPPVDTSGGGTSSCSCPPLDFTPLSGLNLGSKFPFGVLGYASSIVGQFNVTPAAPDFALRAIGVGTNGHGLDTPYDVNLAGTRFGWLDTYMGYWRDLLSFALWIGAVWFLATRLLGIEIGGDPGGATDELL